MVAPLVVGRYRVYEPIAAGGMATVHFARLIGEVGFSRTVAVKRLRADQWGKTDHIASLVDEARLASRIKHPHVVPTLDVFVSGGEIFVVMEYIVGESLARLLRGYFDRGEPLSVPLALAVVTGVLQGLHAAHVAKNELGVPMEIVHRDVSPQNVIVGVDGLARVLDFGIAKASKFERLSSTISGQIKGKIRYMAPEQIRAEAVSPATDVFAVGVLLWEALAGRRLFKTEAEVVRAYAHRERPELLSRVNPEVSRALSDVVDKAMRLDASERWPDALSFVGALEEVADVASNRRLASWVERTAAESLEERERQLAEIERQSAQRPKATGDDDETQTDVGGRLEVSRAVEPAASPVDDRAASRPASEPTASTALERPAVLPARRLRKTEIVALSVVVGGGATIASLALFSGSSNPVLIADRGLEAPPRATPRANDGPERAARLGTSSPSSTAPSAPTTEAPRNGPSRTSFPPVPPVPSGPRADAPPTASVAPAGAAADRCNPPFTIDAQGIQRFKKECL